VLHSSLDPRFRSSVAGSTYNLNLDKFKNADSSHHQLHQDSLWLLESDWIVRLTLAKQS
jgi:hypothetical protein